MALLARDFEDPGQDMPFSAYGPTSATCCLSFLGQDVGRRGSNGSNACSGAGLDHGIMPVTSCFTMVLCSSGAGLELMDRRRTWSMACASARSSLNVARSVDRYCVFAHKLNAWEVLQVKGGAFYPCRRRLQGSVVFGYLAACGAEHRREGKIEDCWILGFPEKREGACRGVERAKGRDGVVCGAAG